MVNADDIFDDREYPYATKTVGKPSRNFYTYFSTTYLSPILGFSGVPEVKLGDYYDYYDDLKDGHRVSIMLTGITCFTSMALRYFFRQ